MSAMREPRSSSAGSEYYYRRRLTAREMLPAIGIGLGAGLAAFYVAMLVAQRTPLRLERRPRSERPESVVPRSRQH